MKLAQIARTVKDISVSEQWYRSVLGLRHLYTYGPLAFFDLDGTRLMLSAEGGANDGESILYFEVADIEATHRELLSRGVVFRDAPRLIHRHESGVEEWMTFFEDPEGRVLALAAKVAPVATASDGATPSGAAADRTDAVAGRMDDVVASAEAELQRRESGGGSLDAPGAAESTTPHVISDEVLTAVLADQGAAFAEPLNEACSAFDITTPLRIAHFLAQTAHESAGYTALVENLNYGAPGLLATWPKRFDAERAAAYARQPEKIANYVYADRMGNGPEASGDGWRFRGRGILQLTGRATYRAAGEALGFDLEAEPELLATPRLAALAAGWYWAARGINALCDRDDVIAVTEAVNGGRNGLDHRVELLGLAKAAMQSGDVRA